MTDQPTPEQLDHAGGARGAISVPFRRKQLVKHIKTGGVYRIVHTPDTCRLEASNEPAYAYQAVWIVSSRGGQINLTDKPLWVRGQAEMEDGRFEPLANPDDQPPRNQRITAKTGEIEEADGNEIHRRDDPRGSGRHDPR